MKIKGSTFVVTGGASGLGEATSRRLVADGANVSIFDMQEDKGKQLVSELGSKAIFCQVNVTDDDSVNAAIKATVEKFGAIHGAINCAGIAFPERVATKNRVANMANFAKVIQINVNGTFNVIRLVAQQMIKQEPNEGGERGVFINTASVAAFEGQIGQTAYSASKGAIVSMTLPMARDLAPFGIRVMTIAPGLFDTPMLRLLPETARAKLVEQVPFPHRLGYPEEYAELSASIISNPMLNGETIRLDAGIRMAAM